MKASDVVRVLKDLTPGDVHVNTATWPVCAKCGGMHKKGAACLTKADPGLYVCRPVLNEAAVIAWALRRGIAPAPNLHVTVVYSTKSIPWVPAQDTILVPAMALLGWETLGTPPCLVLRIDSPTLQARWEQSRARGALWSYPSYKPHMTLACPGDAPPDTPAFDLVLGPEVPSTISPSPYGT